MTTHGRLKSQLTLVSSSDTYDPLTPLLGSPPVGVTTLPFDLVSALDFASSANGIIYCHVQCEVVKLDILMGPRGESAYQVLFKDHTCWTILHIHREAPIDVRAGNQVLVTAHSKP